MGRPRKFDRNKALEDSLHVFWAQGFDGTSLDDLLTKMNINNSSFYQAFSNKEQLFLESLDLYRQMLRDQRIRILMRRTGSAKKNIKKYFYEFVHRGPRSGFPIGCFMANTTAALKDPQSKIGQIVEKGFCGLYEMFVDFLRWGQQQGEFLPTIDVKRTARLFITMSYGSTVVAKVKPNKKQILDTIYQLVDLISTTV